jgi:hypothetical protein
VPDLSLGGLGAVLDLGEKLRFDPDALVCDLLRERLCLADQRRQALLQVCGRDLVEAVVDLAGVDKLVALFPADVEPVPLGAVEGKARDSQRLPLRAGLLDQSLLRPVG